MQQLNKKKLRGFTLIELMIVVVIIGILASLAIYGVQKYVASAKTGEVKTNLGAIAKGGIAAYDGETMSGAMLAPGASVAAARRLCATSVNLVPPLITQVAGQKYQSAESEWATGGQTVGWTCLKMAIRGPQYYQYNYTALVVNPAVPTAGDSFSAIALGDLDADGAVSTFNRDATLVGAVGDLTLTLSPAINELNPDE